jgi:alpha-L-rhamnosidase
MNSFNHYAFGAVGDWMYRYLAGLDLLEPGYRRVAFRPRPGAGLTSARASHESLYGVHSCAWRLEPGGTLHVELAVPPNTTAVLELPPGAALPDRQPGEPIELAPGHHTLAAAAPMLQS